MKRIVQSNTGMRIVFFLKEFIKKYEFKNNITNKNKNRVKKRHMSGPHK